MAATLVDMARNTSHALAQHFRSYLSRQSAANGPEMLRPRMFVYTRGMATENSRGMRGNIVAMEAGGAGRGGQDRGKKVEINNRDVFRSGSTSTIASNCSKMSSTSTSSGTSNFSNSSTSSTSSTDSLLVRQIKKGKRWLSKASRRLTTEPWKDNQKAKAAALRPEAGFVKVGLNSLESREPGRRNILGFNVTKSQRQDGKGVYDFMQSWTNKRGYCTSGKTGDFGFQGLRGNVSSRDKNGKSKILRSFRDRERVFDPARRRGSDRNVNKSSSGKKRKRTIADSLGSSGDYLKGSKQLDKKLIDSSEYKLTDKVSAFAKAIAKSGTSNRQQGPNGVKRSRYADVGVPAISESNKQERGLSERKSQEYSFYLEDKNVYGPLAQISRMVDSKPKVKTWKTWKEMKEEPELWEAEIEKRMDLYRTSYHSGDMIVGKAKKVKKNENSTIEELNYWLKDVEELKGSTIQSTHRISAVVKELKPDIGPKNRPPLSGMFTPRSRSKKEPKLCVGEKELASKYRALNDRGIIRESSKCEGCTKRKSCVDKYCHTDNAKTQLESKNSVSLVRAKQDSFIMPSLDDKAGWSKILIQAMEKAKMSSAPILTDVKKVFDKMITDPSTKDVKSRMDVYQGCTPYNDGLSVCESSPKILTKRDRQIIESVTQQRKKNAADKENGDPNSRHFVYQPISVEPFEQTSEFDVFRTPMASVPMSPPEEINKDDLTTDCSGEFQMVPLIPEELTFWELMNCSEDLYENNERAPSSELAQFYDDLAKIASCKIKTKEFIEDQSHTFANEVNEDDVAMDHFYKEASKLLKEENPNKTTDFYRDVRQTYNKDHFNTPQKPFKVFADISADLNASGDYLAEKKSYLLQDNIIDYINTMNECKGNDPLDGLVAMELIPVEDSATNKTSASEAKKKTSGPNTKDPIRKIQSVLDRETMTSSIQGQRNVKVEAARRNLVKLIKRQEKVLKRYKENLSLLKKIDTEMRSTKDKPRSM